MSAKNPADFCEVWTHEAARGLIESVLRTHGAELGARIKRHTYDPAKPDGTVLVFVDKHHSTQSIRYGLPDDAEELRRLAVAALEDPTHWKSQHRRD